MNFVLVDAPNFVLLVSADSRATARPLGHTRYLNQAFTDLLALMGDDLLQVDCSCSSPLLFDGASRRAMGRILAQYGFDWPPLTVGEFYGLLGYCDRLDALTGNIVFAQDQALQWHGLSEQLHRGGAASPRHALALYAAGNTEALCNLHREQGTMAALGQEYSAFADSLST